MTNQLLRAPVDTPIIKVPELSEYFGVENLWIKDESANPFGTHKDRMSWHVVSKARDLCRGIEPAAICILTTGNAGLSVAAFANEKNLPVIGIIDRSIPPEIKLELEDVCYKTDYVDLEAKHYFSQELRARASALIGFPNSDHILDATNCPNAYKQIASEISEQIKKEMASNPPDTIVLPVGTGDLFVGLAAGLEEANLDIRLVGVTVQRANSLADKLYAYWTPNRSRIQALTRPPKPHRLIKLSLKDEPLVSETFSVVKKHLKCEPSSAAAFLALRKISKPQSVVIVNTGRSDLNPLTRL